MCRTLEESSGTVTELFLSDFLAFFYLVFRRAIEKVDGSFVASKHLGEWCYRLQQGDRTATVSARFHLKSTVAIAYIAWQMIRADKPYTEYEFMCYKEGLGAYHIQRLKRYIRAMPEFDCFEDLTDADSRIHYRHGSYEFVAVPSGILSFNRGRHPDGLICDDILRDPTSTLDISQLKKIETLFFEEVEPMPKEELHIFGTPQHQSDLFTSLEGKTDYDVRRYPAVRSFHDRRTLWPAKYDFDWLMAYRKRVGEKAFNKEMMCRPVHSEEGFLSVDQLEGCIKRGLENYKVYGGKAKIKKACYGGFDIGKKTHPSHLTVLASDRAKRLVQVHSCWMDGWDYNDQLDYLKQAIQQFGIYRMYYDDTRAEFESFKEAGELPAEMSPLTFTKRDKFAIAGGIDRMVTQRKLWLLDEPRQKTQLLNVDNDLKSVTTAEGHGDCFWSLALAIKGAEEGEGNLIWEF